MDGPYVIISNTLNRNSKWVIFFNSTVTPTFLTYQVVFTMRQCKAVAGNWRNFYARTQCTAPHLSKVHIFWKRHKFCEISTLLLSYVVPVKSKVEILQNCVAFSEYMNFKGAEFFFENYRLLKFKEFDFFEIPRDSI